MGSDLEELEKEFPAPEGRKPDEPECRPQARWGDAVPCLGRGSDLGEEEARDRIPARIRYPDFDMSRSRIIRIDRSKYRWVVIAEREMRKQLKEGERVVDTFSSARWFCWRVA